MGGGGKPPKLNESRDGCVGRTNTHAMPRRQEQHLHQQQIEAEGGRAQVGPATPHGKLQELTRVPPDGPHVPARIRERIDEGRECDYPYIDREHGGTQESAGLSRPTATRRETGRGQKPDRHVDPDQPGLPVNEFR